MHDLAVVHRGFGVESLHFQAIDTTMAAAYVDYRLSHAAELVV